MFVQQSNAFFEGIDEEVPFEGGWNPEPNELLIIQVPEEALVFEQTLAQNAFAVETINVANFANAGIRALLVGQQVDGHHRILTQRFTIGQSLTRKFVLFLPGDTFRRLTAPAFNLDTSLTFVIEGGLVKFKSFQKLRSILNLGDIFREATDPEVRDFAQHPSLVVADLEEFLGLADEVTRKLISAVTASGILEDFTPIQIQAAAQQTQLDIALENGAMVFPADRREVKSILRFLNENRYAGPLTQTPYETNSRRPV